MPIRDLKAQIARLPEQPGVYLYFNRAGETLYVGKARVLRDRVRSYLGAHGTSPRIDALLDEAAPPRGHRHRFGRRGAGAREQPHQAASAQVQHPPARRQELSLPAADDRRGVPPRPGGAAGRARRPLLRRPVHAGVAGAPDDVADPQAVRHALVQRDDHRRPPPAVPRVRHQALHRPLRPRALFGGRVSRRRSSTPACSSKGATTSCVTTLRERMSEAAAERAVRAGGAAARRHPHD